MRAGALPRLLETLGRQAQVYAPATEDGLVLLRPWTGQAIATSYVNPVNSLKGLVYPQTEAVLEFTGGDENLSLREAPAPAPQVVFGGRPCDAAGLALIAQVLLEGTFVDELFRRRREATTVLTVACREPGPYCFCRAMGVSPADERGSDVMFYPADDGYLVEAVTARGEEALQAVAGLLAPAPDTGARDACRELRIPLAEKLTTDRLAARLEGFFEHPYWEQVARRCRSCGTCAYLCPTCYCTAIFDTSRGTRGRRLRGWDSCQFKDFLLMAGGHNPRPAKKQRVRNRFLHKLSYSPANHGAYGCVGCGRCVEKCPADLHMVAVLTDLGEVLP
ncbi:MAG: 4Fe-4S dicluster domain-containing protein [bacterium]|nr:4Fe-4S dicluster domain-containing protein [bacterium]